MRLLLSPFTKELHKAGRARAFEWHRHLEPFRNLLSIIMPTERELAISPIVQESVQHNTRVSLLSLLPLTPANIHSQVISNIRSLTASLFGVASGILGLESYSGFAFYLLGTFFVSVLIWALLAKGKQGQYFQGPLSELWAGDVLGGGMSFVLTWTLFYGLVRA